MIYEALCGEKPFQGKTFNQILNVMSKKILYQGPLKRFFERSLSFDKIRRYSTAGEMKSKLNLYGLRPARE